MTTITIQTNNAYGQKLFQKLKEDKNLKNVQLKESEPVNEINLILPGNELSNQELLETLTSASKGKSIPLAQARKKTGKKIALRRKGK
ncbi:hypothetical protein BH11BAC1_BH11BAC1_27810 [soil metagenome]